MRHIGEALAIGFIVLGLVQCSEYGYPFKSECNEEAYRQQGREQMADTVAKILIPDVEKTQ